MLTRMNIFFCSVILLCIKTSDAQDQQLASTTGGPDTTLIPENVVLVSRINTEDDVVAKVNTFGYNLMKTMMKNGNNENIVMSPTGIAGLLAMTLLGSAGTTYDEIAQLIGFSQDILKNREYHENLGSKLQSLDSNDTKTLYANAVFLDAQSRLREVYRWYLDRVYQAEARPVDFHDAPAVKDIINGWVRNHTEDRIKEFLQQPLPVSTKAVLLSALYFSGQWAHPFIEEYTAKLPFTTPSKEISVDLMANFGQFDYLFSYEDELQMLALPYNDSTTTMYVIKPKFPKRLNISQLLDSLTYEKIDRLIDQMSKKKCVIRFPKMELSSKVDLKESLIDLGAETMFKSGQANFALMLESNQVNNSSEEELLTKITTGTGNPESVKDLVNKFPNPGIHVDSVMHEVKMTINEYGTEAVAVTSGIMARSAELFYTDSPFYLFIRNEKTKLVTFSAVVFDPSS